MQDLRDGIISRPIWPIGKLKRVQSSRDGGANFIAQSFEVEQSFSVLIHKSVENYMDRQGYLWSDLDLRFVSLYKSNYIEKMDAK